MRQDGILTVQLRDVPPSGSVNPAGLTRLQHGARRMGQRTSIEWTEVTWNPTTGCTKVSEGCDNCYAETLSRRLLSRIYRRRLPVADTAANRADPFAVRIWPERLGQPAGWKGRRLVFVNSMSDLFHCDIPVDFLRAVFEVMLDVDRHTYQVLTKRPGRRRVSCGRMGICLVTAGCRRISGSGHRLRTKRRRTGFGISRRFRRRCGF